jgi:hypothetical protein
VFQYPEKTRVYLRFTCPGCNRIRLGYSYEDRVCVQVKGRVSLG